MVSQATTFSKAWYRAADAAHARRNRARLLEGAAELFATEGLSVTVDKIARREDVGSGAVHRHFPTNAGWPCA